MTQVSATLDQDRERIRAAQGGDEAAFAALVDAYAPRVHRYLVATGLGHHDADDVVQEAFLRVHRHLDRYDGRYAFSTWLFTIAHRLRLNLATRRRPAAPLSTIAEPATPETTDPEDPCDRPDGIWAIARRLLGDKHYDLLWLRYGEDLDIEAAARICGITAINARVSLHRARTKLEKHLRSAGLAPVSVGGTP